MANPASNRRRTKASIRARQERAMIEQFSESDRAASDRRNWQTIRRAAATRNLRT